MSWQAEFNGNALSWLLDPSDPGVRYIALRDLMDLPTDNAELIAAQELAHKKGEISLVLEKMDEAGFWVKAGPGYSPKYRGTVWAVIILAQLGASIAVDKRIEDACLHLFENALTDNGQFSISGTPSGTADCLQGNLCAAMLDLGFTDDSRLEKAFEWMARSVTGEGVAPISDKKARVRYYSGKYGPNFLCGANNKLPCSWGAVKVMLAFGKLPQEKRTPLIERAIKMGADFLLGVDPAESTYPTGWSDKPSRNWWKFGFPVFYITDLLQNVEALIRTGYGNDPRLKNALGLIHEKQDKDGRWLLEYDYTGKTWVDFGKKKEPNKWVTLRAAWALKEVAELSI